MLIWGADLRPSNAGVNIPAYQRVNTASDYDTVGFPPYLKFDGSNDYMLTGAIDFSATDKLGVVAGVRKLSDAAQKVVTELSATIASNEGAFLLAAPDDANATFAWDSKGTSQVDAVTATDYAAPRTAVLSGTADIAGDSCALRLNGAANATDSGDQGTGNFGNYPLYLGSRAGTSLFFNGRLYSLIVRGAQTPQYLIEAAEAWVNRKTRAY
jgi:hypothetical protein